MFYFVTLSFSLHKSIFLRLFNVLQFSGQTMWLLQFWRGSLELWPHLDGEHLWSANYYLISLKYCSCSPKEILIPTHISCTPLPVPTSEAGEWLGGVEALWKGGVSGINGVLLVEKAQTKRAFSGWDRWTSPHTPGWPRQSRQAHGASKSLCHLGWTLGIKRCVTSSCTFTHKRYWNVKFHEMKSHPS